MNNLPEKTDFDCWLEELPIVNNDKEYAFLVQFTNELCNALKMDMVDISVITSEKADEYLKGAGNYLYIDGLNKIIIIDYDNSNPEVLPTEAIVSIARTLRKIWQDQDGDAQEAQGITEASDEDKFIDGFAFANAAFCVMFGEPNARLSVFEDRPELRKKFFDRIEVLLDLYDVSRR